MKTKNNISRREFLKRTAYAAAAVGLVPQVAWSKDHSVHYDPKGLPTRTFGKTGVKIPMITYGTGSRFMKEDTDKGLELLEYALSKGLYYWDTAASYKNVSEYSEERLGRLLKTHRKKVFLATKVQERDAEGAKRTIERSFEKLQTDYIDLYQIHSISGMEDARNLDGVYQVLKDYQRQGAIRFIGFTGHTSAKAMKYVAENYDLDTMLIALNHMQENQNFEERAMPAAAAKNLGVLGMKVIRPRESINRLRPTDLIKYALSLDHVTAANIAMDSKEVIDTNIEIIRNFQKLSESRMNELQAQLRPFFNHENVEWMKPGYVDGLMA
ncbi:MAG: aldo/keto reductase [Bacteroidales bacterium]|nr:aldo/keto reductase [Bacteroidales bacterium]MBS3776125.1 aldo/keto reductase [Bacteroidales bacterium]